MEILPNTDEYFMQQALKDAQKAFDEDEVPVGAIVVQDNKIIGRGYNMVEKLCDATAHAELIAITAASNFLNSKYLQKCTLYVTLEPCHMCAGALYWSKIGRIVFGASDEKHGFKSFYKTTNPFHPKTEIKFGVMELECADIMKRFFKAKR
jgi:tRNA(adenine34) deaminase